MPPLGRHEVRRRRQRITSLLSSIDGASMGAELTGHYACYMCVLVSGYAEQSVKELVVQYCRARSAEPIQRFVGKQVGKLRNIDLEKLKQLIESFDPAWWRDLSLRHADELEAFGSVAAVRNNVSHGGGDGSITMGTLHQYFEQISIVLDYLCDLFGSSVGGAYLLAPVANQTRLGRG